MPLDLPYRFPNEADKIHEEAQAFRRLSPDERMTRILDLIGSGELLMAASPKREVAQRLRERDEAEWQRRMKELIARHGCTASPAFTEPDGLSG